MSTEQKIIKYPGKKRKIIIGLLTVILIVMMFPKGESIESEVTEGTIWTNDDLIAPFSFPIIKDKETYNSEVKAAQQSVYPVFNSITSKSSDSLKAFAAYVISVIDENLSNQSESNLNPTFLSSNAFLQFFNLRKQQKESKQRDKTLDNILNSAGAISDEVSKHGIINLESNSKIRDSIAVRVRNVDKIESLSKFYFIDQAKNKVKNKIRESNFSEELKEAIIEYTLHFIYPNLVFNEEATNLEIEQFKNNVSNMPVLLMKMKE